MTVPLRSRPGTRTVPVGVLDPTGVAAIEVSADVDRSVSGDGDPRRSKRDPWVVADRAVRDLVEVEVSSVSCHHDKQLATQVPEQHCLRKHTDVYMMATCSDQGSLSASR